MVDEIIEKKSLRLIGIPLTDLAADLGNVKVANMIAIGALVKLKNMFSPETVLKELDRLLESKKEAISLNRKAIKLGYEYGKE